MRFALLFQIQVSHSQMILKRNSLLEKESKLEKILADGFGGFYINEIIKHLNGNFEIFNDVDNSDFTTHFEINFPIFGTNEDEYEYEENI